MVDTISHGKEEVAHFPLAPTHPAFRAAEPVVKKYPYDPRRSEQLFAEAGWRRGADGVLANDRGERFSAELRASARVEFEQPLGAISSYFKGVGVETQIAQMPDRQLSSPDVRNRWPGFYLASHNMQVEDWDDRFHTSNIPTAGNNWVPINVSRWANPAKDRLIAALEDTLDARQRQQLTVEWLKLFAEELPHLPLRYNAEVTSYRSTVKNIPVRIESGGENYRTWNAHVWEKRG
jgi:peptide/nickel transport system substrate-binding protein